MPVEIFSFFKQTKTKTKIILTAGVLLSVLLMAVGINLLIVRLNPKAASSFAGSLLYSGNAGQYIGKTPLIERFDSQFANVIDYSINEYGGAFVDKEGNVYIWGETMLGDGSSNYVQYSPTEELILKQVKIDRVKKIYNINTKSSTSGWGDNFIMAVKEDGSVWRWGEAKCGLLGKNSSIYQPTRIENLNNITQLTFANNSAFALSEDGKVFAWGCNQEGVLGLGGRTEVYSPTQIGKLEKIKKISSYYSSESGGNHVLALQEDGKIYTWGNNSYGQLGTTKNDKANVPFEVPEIEKVDDIAAGADFSLAIVDNQVFGWGNNNSGQLGIDSKTNITTPKNIKIPSKVEKIYAGKAFSIIQDTNDSLWTSGYGLGFAQGQGLKDIPRFTKFEYIIKPKIVQALSAGAVFLGGESTAVGNTVYNPQVNNGVAAGGEMFVNQNGIYTKIPDSFNFESADAMLNNYIAVRKDGTVWTWKNEELPVQVEGLNDIQTVTIGVDQDTESVAYFAIDKKGLVWAWGQNSRYGVLGLGSKYVNEKVERPIQIENLPKIKQLTASANHVIAISEEDTIYAWGDNTTGQLGIEASSTSKFCDDFTENNFEDRRRKSRAQYCPKPFNIPEKKAISAVAISSDASHEFNPITAIVNTDGKVEVWSEIKTEWELEKFENMNYITSDRNNGAVLAGINNDGNVLIFGDNSYRQLARNNPDESYKSVFQVEGVEGAIQIGVKFDHVTVLQKDGKIFSWGSGSKNGLGKNVLFSTPREITTFSNIKSISSNPDVIITGENNNQNNQGTGGNNINCDNNGNGTSLPGQTQVFICVQSGSLSLYAGDSSKNNDICDPNDIINNIVVDTTSFNNPLSSVTCTTAENSIALSSIAVSSSRQSSSSVIYDIVFDDLRGLDTSNYTITASVSNFIDGNKSISLGTNPDSISTDPDQDAFVGPDNNKIFANLNPSAATVTVLRDSAAFNGGVANYQRGQSTTVISPSSQVTLLTTTAPVKPGRVSLDGVGFKLRIPAFVQSGNYKGTITQTII